MAHTTSACALRSELCVGNTTLSSGTQVTVPCVSDGLWTALNTTVGVLKNGGSGGDFVPIPVPSGTGLLQINAGNSTTVATTTPGSKLVMSGDGGFKDAQYLSLMKEPLTDATGGRLVQHHSNETGENRSHFVGGPGVVLTGADKKVSLLATTTHATGKYLDDTGAWSAPPGGSSAPTLSSALMASALGIDANGKYTITVSSRRFKNKIEPLDVRHSARKLDRLRVVGFEYVAHPGHRQVGLIAEEVDDVFPEYVNRQQGEIYNVNYAAFIPELIAGYQALREEVNMLKRQRE